MRKITLALALAAVPLATLAVAAPARAALPPPTCVDVYEEPPPPLPPGPITATVCTPPV